MTTETMLTSNPSVAASDRSSAARLDQGTAPDLVDMGILSRSLAFHVRKAQLALQRRGLRNIAAGNIGPAEFGTLVLCEQNPGLAQFQIAAALDIDKASVVAVVDRLEELGWVVRRRSNQDRRRHGLHLTAAGAHQAEVLRKQAGQVESFAHDLFSPAEMNQLLALLGRLA
jgi:DNA-binding MarR family transcriptional regulator